MSMLPKLPKYMYIAVLRRERVRRRMKLAEAAALLGLTHHQLWSIERNAAESLEWSIIRDYSDLFGWGQAFPGLD